MLGRGSGPDLVPGDARACVRLAIRDAAALA